ncbi:MAG TPA: hypothetical protein VKQ07_08645, partial [Jatrophihabitantaceae bacterium]|nr:hypothetical protein [Jatrophihabitantaceae bacterium]
IVMAAAGPIAWFQIAQRTTQGEGRYLFISIVPISLLLLVPVSWLFQRSGRALTMVAASAWPVAFAAVDAYVFAKYVI